MTMNAINIPLIESIVFAGQSHLNKSRNTSNNIKLKKFLAFHKLNDYILFIIYLNCGGYNHGKAESG